MAEEKMYIPIVLGTNRKERASEDVARWLFGKMSECDDIKKKIFRGVRF